MRRGLVGLVLVAAALTATGCTDPCAGKPTHTELQMIPIYHPGAGKYGAGGFVTYSWIPVETC